jgi:hypothetical protein
MFNNTAQSRAAEYRANSVDEEARTAEFVISTEAPDTYDTVFLSSGWELEQYKRNPVVTYQHRDHDSNPDLVIGTSEVYVDAEKRLIGKITFENGEDNPLAEKVMRKVKNGILRGASIWAYPHEGRYGEKAVGENVDMIYFTRQELRAWSIVTVQSNPDALARNAESLDTIKKELKPSPIIPEKRNDQTTEKITLSRFEAQVLINENSI